MPSVPTPVGPLAACHLARRLPSAPHGPPCQARPRGRDRATRRPRAVPSAFRLPVAGGGCAVAFAAEPRALRLHGGMATWRAHWRHPEAAAALAARGNNTANLILQQRGQLMRTRRGMSGARGGRGLASGVGLHCSGRGEVPVRGRAGRGPGRGQPARGRPDGSVGGHHRGRRQLRLRPPCRPGTSSASA